MKAAAIAFEAELLEQQRKREDQLRGHSETDSRCDILEGFWMGSYVGRHSKLLKNWSHPPGSNRRPADYESAALPTELRWLNFMITKFTE